MRAHKATENIIFDQINLFLKCLKSQDTQNKNHYIVAYIIHIMFSVILMQQHIIQLEFWNHLLNHRRWLIRRNLRNWKKLLVLFFFFLLLFIFGCIRFYRCKLTEQGNPLTVIILIWIKMETEPTNQRTNLPFEIFS